MIKKVSSFLIVLLLLASTCFAYTPSPDKWEYVASDRSGNSLYVTKDPKSIKAYKNALVILTLAITPNGDGSYFIDEVIKNFHNDDHFYGDVVHHRAKRVFKNSHMLTKDFISADENGRRVFYSVTDPWFKAEFDYAFKKADELGLKYN